MRHFYRAAAILGIGMFLLAAGDAPNADPGFLAAAPLAEAPASIEVPAGIEAPAIIEEPLDMVEPELAPTLPESASLTAMVSEVRTMPALSLDRELECLATAVYYESKGEPLEGQLAVAQVIINRVERGRFGTDICAVVKAPKQFSFVKGGQLSQPGNNHNWQTARAIAIIASAEAWRDIVGEATHFHASRVSPGWRMQRVAQVGNHIFYR